VVAALVVGALAVAGTYAWDSADSSGTSAGQPLDPATFATGSCVAYSPTQGNRRETVFLDAGHGGIDPGGVGVTQSGRTIDEADETLPVELDVMGLLRSQGYRVVVSRTGASTVLRLGPQDVSGGELSLLGAHDDVAARDVCANDARAQVMVGIYYNAGGTSQDAGCITAYDPDRPFSAANLELADLVQDDVLTRMNAQGWGIPNDGVQPDSGLGSLDGSPASGGIAGEAAAYDHLMLIGPALPGFFSTPSQMPGVVIEPLYITDPFEGSIADSQTGQTVIAEGIASAVEHYLAPRTSASG
jgi:N-acetylmuramoyl-L-alanine amidase